MARASPAPPRIHFSIYTGTPSRHPPRKKLLRGSLPLAVLVREMGHVPKRLVGSVSLCVAALSAASVCSDAHAGDDNRWTLGLGPAVFVEDTHRSQATTRLGETDRGDESAPLDSRGIYNLQAWVLVPLWKQGWKKHLRGGGGLAWYSRYTLTEGGEDASFEAGNLLQLYAQTEYLVERVVQSVDAVFGLRGGPLLLFASGDLQRDLDDLSDRGYSIWPTPRLGVFVAPHAGARYPLTPRVRLRGDVSLQLERLWLVRASARDGSITSEQRASLATTRSQLLVGLELSL